MTNPFGCRAAARLTAFVGIASLALVACGGGDDAAGGDAGSSDDPGQFTYWSYWSEGEPHAELMAEAIAAFEDETGIEVDVQWQGRDLSNRILPTLATGTPGADLIDLGSSAARNSFYLEGHAADLSDVLDAEVPGEGATVQQTLSDSYLVGNTDADTGEVFSIPYEGISYCFWYNAERFPELADDPPRTWDEFLTILDEQGDGALALDGTVTSYAGMYLINFVLSYLGPGGWYEAATDETGELFRTEPAYLEAAQRVQELVDAGYFLEGYSASKFPAMQQKWSNNEADFIINGSWLPAEVEPYAAPEFEFRSFQFPAVSADRPLVSQLSSIGFVVLEDGENVEAAKKFIPFFIQKGYQERIGQLTLPARGDVDTAERFADLNAALNDPEMLITENQDGVSRDHGDWVEKVFNVLNTDLINGKITAEEFIDKIATDSAKYWAANG